MDLCSLLKTGNKFIWNDSILESYLQPMITAVDYLVLGCSHYPYLIPQIKKILPSNIQIIDSGGCCDKQTNLLENTIGMSTNQKLILSFTPTQTPLYWEK
jgi:glutamate racemase